ncbi:hypothetical protein AMECASPLE_032282 [Ameca splendens]|uniref:Uncharacterized protein n=1 Tax=Ameca splendens TaxID=208324 RepID=A0ABV0Y762_9TELE
MEEASPNANSQTTETNVLDAIQALKIHFSTQLREVVTSNQEIKDTVGVFLERLNSAESHIGNVEDSLSSLTSKEASLRKMVQELTLKVDDLENRNRREY